ncbi:mitochondrial genome maintenance protein [Kwoniella mangroviensis CBS 10435]|uniref:Mitochondrial genome maintenance protein MGM101 n=1 Tax=Kwoniella mangroviensis CBS 10435 TaxID=1331196 RepID=A0A1B9J0F3_9TREE|nr:mitochondrial genome maintenance protein [Kwoniella mangroviensis CBS 10435]
MPVIASSIRLGLVPRSLSLRSLSTFSPSLAAAATSSPAPTTSRYVRKTAVPIKPSSAKATSSTSTSKTSKFNPSPTPTAPSPQANSEIYDDFPDDFPLPSNEPVIDDYSHLAPTTPSTSAPPTASPPLTNLPGESYTPLPSAGGITGEAPVGEGNDWSSSFAGLSERPFPKEVANELLRELRPEDVEIKPDGLLYLPEIKYRRTLNAAFGPGGWGLAPRGETNVGPRIVSREWGLVCLGRLVSIARGEQEYFDPSGIPTATEACKSNALMRCCKDLGIASELWDPSFIREFKAKHCKEVYVEHATTKKKKKLWRKTKGPKFEYPWREGA